VQTEESQKIIKRFFEALYALKKQKIIHGKSAFIKRYGINSRNLWQLEQDISRDIFQVAWLANMVNDYGISAEWLLTGEGKMFNKTRQKEEQVADNSLISADVNQQIKNLTDSFQNQLDELNNKINSINNRLASQ
jgi:hypothetical protein